MKWTTEQLKQQVCDCMYFMFEGQHCIKDDFARESWCASCLLKVAVERVEELEQQVGMLQRRLEEAESK